METFSALLALCAGKSPVTGVKSPHKGQSRGALIFSLISTWINARVSNREAGDLRRAHYDVIVMYVQLWPNVYPIQARTNDWYFAVGILKSLFLNWKFLFWFDFDCNLARFFIVNTFWQWTKCHFADYIFISLFWKGKFLFYWTST